MIYDTLTLWTISDQLVNVGADRHANDRRDVHRASTSGRGATAPRAFPRGHRVSNSWDCPATLGVDVIVGYVDPRTQIAMHRIVSYRSRSPSTYYIHALKIVSGPRQFMVDLLFAMLHAAPLFIRSE